MEIEAAVPTVEREPKISADMSLARSCLLKLKRKYPFLSRSQIAEKIGIGNATLHRVENGVGKPNIRTLMRLLSSIGLARTIAEVEILLQQEGAALPEGVNEHLSHLKNVPVLDEDLAEGFKNKERSMILLMASYSGGTTREEIRGEYGSNGIRLLDDMLRTGTLKEEDGAIKSSVTDQEGPWTIDHRTFKELLVSCIQEKYDPDLYGSGKNWFSFQGDSVDMTRAMPEIREIIQGAFVKIEEVLRSKEYQGKDKMFVGMVSDSLISNGMNQQGED